MGIYLVTWKWRWLSQEVRNTFYYETTVGEPSNSEWQDVVDEIRGDVFTQFQGWFVTECEWYGISRRRVDQLGLPTFDEVPTAGGVVGTETAESVATQVAVLASVKGSTAKPNRARSYLPGVGQVYMVNSQWGAGVVAAAKALIELQSVLNAGGTNPLQRVAAQWNSSHTQVVATNNISASLAVISLTPATQRRRRIGVGI